MNKKRLKKILKILGIILLILFIICCIREGIDVYDHRNYVLP